jgi:oxygen-independent coproporphyrinogen-3 oxidase
MIRALAEPKAAYVHVPFCAHRCGYCDFTLVAGRDELIEPYLRALALELQALHEPRQIDTLFLGGGTPTHLPLEQLARLLTLLDEWFVRSPGCEFSIEANPIDLDAALLDLLVERGVNRISLGVQSFDNSVLETLERDHRACVAEAAIARAQHRVGNVAIDLIFGVPGQSFESWRSTLAAGLALRPEHISTYGLTFEKGTSFWGRRQKGGLRALDEEAERAMFAMAIETLSAAGYLHYEVSNFARPGCECRHNQTYWAALPYWGFGPGAARYVNGRRETNHRSVTTWLKRTLAGQPALQEAEELAPVERAREALVLGLRRTAGVCEREFLCTTGFDLEQLAGPRIERLVGQGLLERASNAVRLSREGLFLADRVFAELL